MANTIDLSKYTRNHILTVPKEIAVLGENIREYIVKNKIKGLRFEQGSVLYKVEERACAFCENLESVNFSNAKSLKVIKEGAFQNCDKLTEVNFKGCKDLRRIDDYAFLNCIIEDLDFSDCTYLRVFGKGCFEMRYTLKNLIFPKNTPERDADLAVIKPTAFRKSCIRKLDLSDMRNLNELAWYSFGESTYIKEVNLKGCKKLNSLYFAFNRSKIGTLNICDSRDVYLIDNSIKAEKVILRRDLKNGYNVRFKDLFPKENNTKIELVLGDKISESFEGCGSYLSNLRIGAMRLLNNTPEVIDLAKNMPHMFNICNDKQDLKIVLQNKEILKKVCSLIRSSRRSDISIFLSHLGFMGFDEDVWDYREKDVKTYKDLLVNDYVYHILRTKGLSLENPDKKNLIVNTVLSKNKTLQRRVSKMDLQELICMFVINNFKDYEYLDNFFGDFTRRTNSRLGKLNIKFLHFLVLNIDEFKKDIIPKYDIQSLLNRDFQAVNTNDLSLRDIFFNFDKILKSTNKTPTDRSYAQRLAIEDCKSIYNYTDIKPGNEELAKLCMNCRVNQENFDKLQALFARGEVAQGNEIIRLRSDNEDNSIYYKVIKHGDPLGLLLGDITNCCQKVSGLGHKCMEIGATDPNSLFVAFYHKDINGDKKIIGQSWVWYNQKNGVLAFDNIEVPSVFDELVNKIAPAQVIDCIDRCCNNVYDDMKKTGFKIKDVVIGANCTDIQGLKDYYKFKQDKNDKYIVPFKDDNGLPIYSDLLKDDGRFVVYEDGKRVYAQDCEDKLSLDLR